LSQVCFLVTTFCLKVHTFPWQGTAVTGDSAVGLIGLPSKVLNCKICVLCIQLQTSGSMLHWSFPLAKQQKSLELPLAQLCLPSNQHWDTHATTQVLKVSANKSSNLQKTVPWWSCGYLKSHWTFIHFESLHLPLQLIPDADEIKTVWAISYLILGHQLCIYTKAG